MGKKRERILIGELKEVKAIDSLPTAIVSAKSQEDIESATEKIIQHCVSSIAQPNMTLASTQRLLVFVYFFRFLVLKFTDFNSVIIEESGNVKKKRFPRLSKEAWASLKERFKRFVESYGDDTPEKPADTIYDTKSFQDIEKPLCDFLEKNINRIYKEATTEVKFMNPDNEEDSYDPSDQFIFQDLQAQYIYIQFLILRSNSLEELVNYLGRIMKEVLTLSHSKSATVSIPAHLLNLITSLMPLKELKNILLLNYNNEVAIKCIEKIVLEYGYSSYKNIDIAYSFALNSPHETEPEVLLELLSFSFLSLLNCEISTNSENTDSRAQIGSISIDWKTAQFFTTINNKYDGVFAFLPSRSRIEQKQRDFLGTNKLEFNNVMDSLKEGGWVISLVPENFLFNKGPDYVLARKRMLSELSIEAIISLPLEMWLPRSSAKTSLIILKRHFPPTQICFYKIQNDGFSHDRKRLPIEQNDIPFLLKDWDQKDYSKRFIKIQEKEIAENGYNLSTNLWNEEYLKLRDQIHTHAKTWNLDEVCDIKRGLDIKVENKTARNTEIPIIHAANLERGTINFDSVQEFFINKGSKRDNVIRERVVLLVIKGKGVLLADFDPLKSKYKAIVVPRYIIVLRPNERQIHFDYFITSMESEFVQNQISLVKSGSYIPSISLVALRQIKIPAVPLLEQVAYVRAGEQQKREDYLHENKLLNYLNQLNIPKTIEEAENSLAEYIKDELGEKVEVVFRERKGMETLTPFSLDDIKEGKILKINSSSSVSLLNMVKGETYGVIDIKGKDVSHKISQEMAFRFSVLVSSVIQIFRKVQEAADEKMANYIAHEFKNACRKILNQVNLVKNVIERNSVKDLLVYEEAQVDQLIESRGRGQRGDFSVINTLEKISNEVTKVKNIATKIDEYRKINRDKYMQDIDLAGLINRLIDHQKVNFKTMLKTMVIQGVEAPLKTAISNFIDNAVEYSPDSKCEVILNQEKEVLKVSDKKRLRMDYQVTITIKNKTRTDLSEDLLSNLGVQPVNSAKGGVGFYYSKKLIEENNRGYFSFKYDKKDKEFIVILEFLKER